MYKIFYNPFEKYAAEKLVPFGILSVLIGAFLAYCFNAEFDGALDLHFDNSVNIYQILTFLIVDIALLSFSLIIFGKYINPKTRIIDIYATVLVAKIPAYLFTFLNINNYSYNLSQKIVKSFLTKNAIEIDTIDYFALSIQTIASMILIVWTIILLYNGFKIATNAKETKDKILFAVAILIAEIISKIIIKTLS